MDNYYKILNISKNATQQDIKHAYRQLIKKYHPDNFPQDEEFAKKQLYKICEAYAALTNKISEDNSSISATDLFNEFMNFCKSNEDFKKRMSNIIFESMTFSFEVASQPIITDNIEEKLQRVKEFEINDDEIPPYQPIEGYFDFDSLSQQQLKFYNYYKNKVRQQALHEISIDVNHKYKTLFACEIICGYGVTNSDEGLQCLIDMAYDVDWIYSYWLTTKNSLSFEDLNNLLSMKGMLMVKTYRTKLNENDLDDLFDFITYQVTRMGYFYDSGAFCKKSEENLLLYKKCLIAILDRFIKIFHEHNKNFVDYILHIKYKQEVSSLYIYENHLPFNGKFDFTSPLKEQKNGEYYWHENGKWYCDRPYINLDLCNFLVKSVENILRKKDKIYRYLKDDYDSESYYASKCADQYNFTEFMSIEDFRKIITNTVESIWNESKQNK